MPRPGRRAAEKQTPRESPGVRVNLPAITPKDTKDILFGLERDVDFIALSFVREAGDIEQLKALMGDKVGRVKIVAKIEDQEGSATWNPSSKSRTASWWRAEI